MAFTPANKVIGESSGFTSASDVIIARHKAEEDAKKATQDTSIVGKAKAFAGGFAESVGATLPAEAINYVGTKLVDKFGTDQMKQNLANAKPVSEQFNDITNQTENPNSAIAGNIIGIPAGFVEGTGAVKGLVNGTSDLVKTIPVVAKYVAKKDATKSSEFIKSLITPALSAKDTATAIKTGKVIEAGTTGTRDLSKAIPGFDNIYKAVSEVKGVSPKKTLLQNVNAIHDGISEVATSLKTQIKGKGDFTPEEFKNYLSVVKNDLAENPTLVGDAEKTATKILDKFVKLVEQKGHNGDGLLEARQALDTWMKSQKGNAFNSNTESAVSIALKAIRQGGNDFLAEKIPDVAVKKLLAKQSRLYDAIENIAPKAAKEGVNGLQRWVKAHPNIVKVAKYTAGLTGAGAVANQVFGTN